MSSNDPRWTDDIRADEDATRATYVAIARHLYDHALERMKLWVSVALLIGLVIGFLIGAAVA